MHLLVASSSSVLDVCKSVQLGLCRKTDQADLLRDKLKYRRPSTWRQYMNKQKEYMV